MPKLRIVIPTKNEENYLPKLLNSIKKQSFKDFEIVVADANSIDNTKSIAKKYGCKIVKGGPTDIGKNNGVEGCKTHLICFIDADVVLPDKEYLSKAMKEFEERKLDVAGTLQKPTRTNKYFKNILYYLFYEIANICMKLSEKTKKPLMQCVIFVKTYVNKAVHGFPPLEFGEDSAFAKIAVSKGYKFGILKTIEKVSVSPRRLETNGFFLMLIKYIYLNTLTKIGYEFKRGKTKIKYW